MFQRKRIKELEQQVRVLKTAINKIYDALVGGHKEVPRVSWEWELDYAIMGLNASFEDLSSRVSTVVDHLGYTFNTVVLEPEHYTLVKKDKEDK